jgi:hypothetical protein
MSVSFVVCVVRDVMTYCTYDILLYGLIAKKPQQHRTARAMSFKKEDLFWEMPQGNH